MKYFDTLPKIYIDDYNGNYILATNLLARSELIPSLLKNPLLFYAYDIQEGDTPDSIANKYYGDPYRYWMIFFANQIIDPQWDWPMTSQQFGDYLVDKYSAYALSVDVGVVTGYCTATIYGYTKTISTVDGLSGVTTTNTYNIDLPTYQSLLTSVNTQYFPDGNYVTQIVTKTPLSIYDYETQQNEAKRSINLINNQYVSLIESQFKSLMSN